MVPGCWLCFPCAVNSPLSRCAEHLNSQFVQFLLDVIEDGLPSDTTDQLPDLFVNVLLAFNLHIPGGSGAAVPGQGFGELERGRETLSGSSRCCSSRSSSPGLWKYTVLKYHAKPWRKKWSESPCPTDRALGRSSCADFSLSVLP